MMRRFFRVYAHAYLIHFGDIRTAPGDTTELEGSLNFCFKHFIFIAKEFDLVEPADMVPLQALIAKFEQQADEREKPPKMLRRLPPVTPEGARVVDLRERRG